ncbi:CLUMA_CG003894, isoform A [Clunio marinus]|uniref:CLUMA_CG003894, isoform A n=1 Tax=Clunio marinus TaxID=568069 RepID=A0A1J1HS16_9DIPT|nr:CLUMA_CG003894, isoform A [Clunio marinus]
MIKGLKFSIIRVLSYCCDDASKALEHFSFEVVANRIECQERIKKSFKMTMRTSHASNYSF